MFDPMSIIVPIVFIIVIGIIIFSLGQGLEYKKYTPKNDEKNWFRGLKYSGQTIMKFRFSSKMRCFGYRKENKFMVLRLERDHSISENG